MIRLLACLVLVAAAGATDLVCSGVIGQSQPPDAEPIPSIGFTGVASAGGRVWAVSGRRLYGFSDAGVVDASLELPTGVVAVAALWQTQGRLVVQLADRRVAVVDPGRLNIERIVVLPEGTERIFCHDADPGGWPLLALTRQRVIGMRLDGGTGQPLVELPKLPASGWQAVAVADDGAILVGAAYPDQRQYRFTVDGRQVDSDGWPRRGQAVLQYLRVGGTTWTLRANGAITRPDAEGIDGGGPGRGTARQVWNNYSTGIAPAGDGWWLSSSQGLLRLEASGRVRARIGGAPGIRACSLSREGEIMALVEGGQRVLRFAIDAMATSAPASAGNEPWRIGRGWSTRAPAIIPDGPVHLVLDETAGRLWTFDQPRTGPDTTREWTPRTAAGTWAAARDLAGGTVLVRVLDGMRILEADRRADPLAFRDAGIAFPADFACCHLAAEDDGDLYAASATTVIRFARSPAGVYSPVWSVVLGRDIAAIAVSAERLLIADRGARCVVLADAGNGAALATLRAADVPGGRLLPTAVAIRQPWAVAADGDGARLLRLRIK